MAKSLWRMASGERPYSSLNIKVKHVVYKFLSASVSLLVHTYLLQPAAAKAPVVVFTVQLLLCTLTFYIVFVLLFLHQIGAACVQTSWWWFKDAVSVSATCLSQISFCFFENKVTFLYHPHLYMALPFCLSLLATYSFCPSLTFSC